MAFGLGLSIGTVNTVSAQSVGAASARIRRRRRVACPPAVTHRTTLTFDSTGLARLGTIPRHGRAVTEFADLTQRKADTARVGNQDMSPADLVAVVVDCLIAESQRDPRAELAGTTLTYPVNYTQEHLDELREALDLAELSQVELLAEPVAAASWLEAEHGPLMPGLALVYDLGGAGLDVTLLRVGAGRPDNPVVGTPIRSADYGGRALAAQSAGCTQDQIAARRAEHVRESLAVVYRCLRSADLTMANVDRVLVLGGASRPPEVARVLAEELARPVVIADDPERTAAWGAAIVARDAALAEVAAQPTPPRALPWSRRARQLSKAAALVGAVSAGIALSAATSADSAYLGLVSLIG